MRCFRPFLAGIAILVLTSVPAQATYNATVIGTIDWVEQVGPNVGYMQDTIAFRLTNQPSVTCSSGLSGFAISAQTVPDAESRKNMLAMLLTAKATGSQLQVAYDSNANGYCDHGMLGVYYITVR